MTTVGKQERSVAINPTRTCAPIGAMLATYGIHGALTINHGSQGCATYPRHQMTRHFREPVEIATTSLTEKTTVYGGRENLLEALKNIYERYHPTMITVCSTCLSETIGDDISAIIDEFRTTYTDAEELPMLSVHTPSYVGTHITGFDNFLDELARAFPEKRRGSRVRQNNGKVNLIPGWVNPGDLRELKYILKEMAIESIILTDYADTLDGGYYDPKPHFPKGGTTMAQIRESGSSMATIALQKHIGGRAARTYETRYHVPAYVLPMPIGLTNTDKFLETLSDVTGNPISEELEMERARLLDAFVDTHMFNSGLKVGIYGDPDLVEGLTRFVAEMGMEPKVAITATESEAWGKDMKALCDELGLNMNILTRSDLHEMHKLVKKYGIDIIIGHSKGKFIADAEKIPLIRVGFPIEDRFGYHRRSIVGYKGALYLLDEITNAVLSGRGSVVSNTVMDKSFEIAKTAILPAFSKNGHSIDVIQN